SMPSGLPGSKSMRNEKPLLSPGAPVLQRFACAPVFGFERSESETYVCVSPQPQDAPRSQAEPHRQLLGGAPVRLDEIPDVFGDWLPGDVASALNLLGDLTRHVIGPMLKRVEGDDAHRRVELAPKSAASPSSRCGCRDAGTRWQEERH